MFDMGESVSEPFVPTMEEPISNVQNAMDDVYPESLEVPSSIEIPSALSLDAPDDTLMGMVLNGLETIEYPSGSGTLWVRDEPEHPWHQKL